MSMDDFSLYGSGFGWMLEGECRHYPADMFFPDDDETAVVALTVCASCKVTGKCLAYALVHAEHGVWGAMSERQRRDLKRELRDAQEQTNEAQGP